MKYIIGIVVGILLSVGGVVWASSGMEIVNKLDVGSFGRIYKVYDNDNQVVCYTWKAGYAGGISCLK